MVWRAAAALAVDAGLAELALAVRRDVVILTEL
jgi:hypothetical protein